MESSSSESEDGDEQVERDEREENKGSYVSNETFGIHYHLFI